LSFKIFLVAWRSRVFLSLTAICSGFNSSKSESAAAAAAAAAAASVLHADPEN